MNRLIAIGCIAAAAAMMGCSEEAAPPARTTGTTETLLAQPRGEDLATPIEGRLAGGEPVVSIDDLGINMGSPEAPMKVIEFVDFGCGYCRRFHDETFSTIAAEYMDTGKIEWKLLPFVSGMFGNTNAVTQASECALDQNLQVYAAFTAQLWARQGEWKASDDPEGLSREWLGLVGGDLGAYDTCLEQGTRENRVASATAIAAQLGVRSTPTFWIVGVGPILGALPVDAFRQVFDQVYEQLETGA